MNRTQHPSANHVLQAPPGMTHEECTPLAVTRVLFGGDIPAVVSYWTPTPDELALLAAGRPVRLSVLGQTMPPVALGVERDGCMPELEN